jgi:hypothetical protein
VHAHLTELLAAHGVHLTDAAFCPTPRTPAAPAASANRPVGASAPPPRPGPGHHGGHRDKASDVAFGHAWGPA